MRRDREAVLDPPKILVKSGKKSKTRGFHVATGKPAHDKNPDDYYYYYDDDDENNNSNNNDNDGPGDDDHYDNIPGHDDEFNHDEPKSWPRNQV